MRRLSKFIALTSGIISCMFLLVNIADITLGVIARQSGISSIVWTEELARISLVWCVMMGASAAFYEGDNMSIDFAVNMLPEWGKRLCRVIAFVIECIVLGVLVYYGAQNVSGGWTMRSLALRIPRAVPLMAVPIGMGLFLAVLVSRFFCRER
ncbi:MAG: TRAP transporter small permease [Synergistaceae bacterium]|nr:TRAP transporter small permease [Synergistaceae bacterium]